MDERRWERVAGATGPLFVALLVLAVFMVPRPPPSAGPADEIRTFFVESQRAIRYSVFVAGLAAIAFLWWLGSLRAYLRRSEGGAGRLSAVAFGAGIASIATVAPSYALWATLVPAAAGDADPALIQTLYDASFQFQMLAAFAGAALVGAASMSGLRSGSLPGWLAKIGVPLAVAVAVGGADVFLDGTFFGPQGGYGFAVYFLFLLWVVVVSAVMIQRLGRRADVPEPVLET